MGRENLQTLRRLADLFARRDVDTALESCAPDIVVRPAVHGVDTRATYRGRDEARMFWDLLSDGWESMAIEHLEMFEAPGNRVVAVERWHFRGRDGLELHLDLFDVYTFRAGLITRIEGFRDRAAAVEATRRG